MSPDLRIAGIIEESIVDGPGIRFVVFAQGCNHHCPGCHNPETQPFDRGTVVQIETLLRQMSKNPLLDGVSISGGEPFEQAEVLAELAAQVQKKGLNVVTYTGYIYEEILANASEQPGWSRLLKHTDILVDGRFELAQRNLLLKFRGSENQRLIDVKKSLESGEIQEAIL
ncbi:anaerobic ribonucleoside-triphosphate reductase activating protein [Desulfosporosinus meridiei]|uniref:Anaerobic ribonucleoside-triphosphate reductase-activating protein n=1 Tax=Desulfosporosinus meridiei (strain ATCC BAA-275 / DSM 13257 / KCTC 12902 / NCIMB 13706 / S10) TaxID=768704 RepID=J7ILV2_DESMD|nr:anaerobic ribonucleoside-triphosphate reductase activating protein [Desulfosporosinus meridiei]AFQ42555.1 anaerobic ribonucleoside-triphosphate reductase activating protein [Desulfosporosinus meridiei DSM 13257]